VAALVGGRVLVDLDEHHTVGTDVLLGPVGRDEYVFATHGYSCDSRERPCRQQLVATARRP
jgi:hypothetical protein